MINRLAALKGRSEVKQWPALNKTLKWRRSQWMFSAARRRDSSLGDCFCVFECTNGDSELVPTVQRGYPSSGDTWKPARGEQATSGTSGWVVSITKTQDWRVPVTHSDTSGVLFFLLFSLETLGLFTRPVQSVPHPPQGLLSKRRTLRRKTRVNTLLRWNVALEGLKRDTMLLCLSLRADSTTDCN